MCRIFLSLLALSVPAFSMGVLPEKKDVTSSQADKSASQENTKTTDKDTKQPTEKKSKRQKPKEICDPKQKTKMPETFY